MLVQPSRSCSQCDDAVVQTGMHDRLQAARSRFICHPAAAGSKTSCHDAVLTAAVTAGKGGGPYVSLAGVPGSSSMAAVRPAPSCWSITSTMSETVMASSASWHSGPCCHANPSSPDLPCQPLMSYVQLRFAHAATPRAHQYIACTHDHDQKKSSSSASNGLQHPKT